MNLNGLPGEGKLVKFESAAADFMKNREYRGLDPEIGKTEVKKASKGLSGIASYYTEDDTHA